MSSGQDRCSEDCLALGAIWHFLKPKEHTEFVAERCRQRRGPYARLSGRVCVQLDHALFAADFRISGTSGVPTPSNPEVLYENYALKRPVVLPQRTLPLPRYILRKEWWREIKRSINDRAAVLIQRLRLGLSWTATIVFACFGSERGLPDFRNLSL